MSLLQPLVDLQTEINRLMIAGSRFASNDPRLAKLLPIFQKMGEKAPVFQKIASNIETLLKSTDNESAGRLTELSTLVYAVLYTQGKSAMDGDETASQPMMDIQTIQTPLTYLELEPTITALSTTGSGRYEILTTAIDQGLIHDVRLYAYIARAIEDKYSEIAERIIKDVIPAIGAPMIPFLLKDVTMADTKGNAMRIEILDRLGASLSEDMITEIMNSNATKLQVALVPSLSRDPKYLPILMAAVKGKKKAVKEAAFIGLARTQSPEAWTFLLESFQKVKTYTALEVISNALEPLDHLNGYEAQLIIPLRSAITTLTTFDWSEDYNRTSELMAAISLYIRMFYHVHDDDFIQWMMDLSELLHAHPSPKKDKDSSAEFKIFKKQFNLLQWQIALTFALLRLPENDPKFETTLHAIHIENHYSKLNLLREMNLRKVEPHFIYRTMKLLPSPNEGGLLHFIHHLDFLMLRDGFLDHPDEIYANFFITHHCFKTVPNPESCDPRWADYLYEFCSTQQFLLWLHTPNEKRAYTVSGAFCVLSLFNAIEPKDSTRLPQLYERFINYLHYEKLGTLFVHLEERIGKAAHPIILAKADAEINRLENRASPGTKHMNFIKERIQSRQSIG